MARKRARRNRAASTEQQVKLGAVGVPFVEDHGQVHGTPSDPERKSRGRGAYAASSVIERGTANVLKTQIDSESDDHKCVCGCGQVPSQADSLFMPGHDSKVRSMGKAVKEGRLDIKKIPDIARKYLEAGGMLA